jgi:hypothetical protein
MRSHQFQHQINSADRNGTTPKRVRAINLSNSPEKNPAPVSFSASSIYAKEPHQRNQAATNVITHRGDSWEFKYYPNQQLKDTFLGGSPDLLA